MKFYTIPCSFVYCFHTTLHEARDYVSVHWCCSESDTEQVFNKVFVEWVSESEDIMNQNRMPGIFVFYLETDK